MCTPKTVGNSGVPLYQKTQAPPLSRFHREPQETPPDFLNHYGRLCLHIKLSAAWRYMLKGRGREFYLGMPSFTNTGHCHMPQLTGVYNARLRLGTVVLYVTTLFAMETPCTEGHQLMGTSNGSYGRAHNLPWRKCFQAAQVSDCPGGSCWGSRDPGFPFCGYRACSLCTFDHLEVLHEDSASSFPETVDVPTTLVKSVVGTQQSDGTTTLHGTWQGPREMWHLPNIDRNVPDAQRT